MPDYPSMADPNSLMPVQQDQPIQQGPTVQATAPTTNSLADIATLAIPALVGLGAAKSRGDPGLMGVMAGLGKGADAMQAERVNAQRYQQALEDRQYRQTAMMQAQENVQRMQMVNAENKKKIAFRDQTAATITDPAEKELFLSNPSQWSKMQMIKEGKPGDVAFIVKASKGQLDAADVSAMSDETRHALAVDLAKGIGQNKSYSAVKVPLDPKEGTYTWMLQDQKGDAKFIPGRDIQGGPEEPAKNKGEQTDAQKIKTAEMLGAQWEKLAAQHRQIAMLTPPTADQIIDPDRWAKENPKEKYIVDQTALIHRVALNKDKQADQQVKKDEKQTAAFDEVALDLSKYSDPGAALPVLRKAFPDLSPEKLAEKYYELGGQVPK